MADSTTKRLSATASGRSNRRRLRTTFLALSLVPPLASLYGQSTTLYSLYRRSATVAHLPLPSRPPPRIPPFADGPSLLLLREARRPRPVFDEDIDIDVEAKRCERYGLGYDGRKTRRRVFFGGLIADDSWGTIAISAIENYGIFHTVAFAESNRTQMKHPREWRFAPGSENLQFLKGGMFGPITNVTVDQYVNEGKHAWLHGLGREHHQRALVLERWKANGMREDDIGYLADVDEMFTRDFLRAAQICRVKEFDDHGNCSDPKLGPSTLQFEGGPRCLTNRRWYHPDMIIG
ncbi:hypothetical protein ACHAWF_004841 [Thalassiosira exigua]